VFVPLMAPAAVPDGRRPAGALEARRRCPTWRVRLRWALAVSRGDRRRSCRSAHGRSWASLGGLLPGVLDRRAASVADAVRARRAASARRWPARLGCSACSRAARWRGMMLAHLGVAVFVVGVTLVKTLRGRARRAAWTSGDTARDRPATRSRFEGAQRSAGPQLPRRARHRCEVTRNGGSDRRRCTPRSASTACSSMPMTEAAIRTGLHARPVRVAGRAAGRRRLDACASTYKPFVDWIWGGCVLMALGGLLAVIDRRYRARRTRRSRRRRRRGRRRPERADAGEPEVTCCRWRCSSCWRASSASA
jgi:cytochrome c-type biogenesis protein CcmF